MSLETTRERKEKGGERGEKKKGLLALIIFINIAYFYCLLNDKKVLATHRSDTSTERYRFQKSGYILA